MAITEKNNNNNGKIETRKDKKRFYDARLHL